MSAEPPVGFEHTVGYMETPTKEVKPEHVPLIDVTVWPIFRGVLFANLATALIVAVLYYMFTH